MEIFEVATSRLTGNRMAMAAPTNGPTMVPAPPTTTISMNNSDGANAKGDGSMNPISGAYSAPAKPP